MGWADSLGNLRVLDKWRAAIGLEYDIEKPAQRINTISGRAAVGDPAPHSASARSPAWRSRPRSSRSASRISAPSPAGAILLDAFFEAGGNLFDTAYVYGGGGNGDAARRMATNRAACASNR